MLEKLKKVRQVFYIKLGKGGKYEYDCIIEDQNLRLGFGEVPHELCARNEWEKVDEILDKAGRKVADTRRQIECFYTSDENTLWVTFYSGKLWWCFSKKQIKYHPSDRTKTRPVIGKWSSTDIDGEQLEMNLLNGKLVQVQRYQGTICEYHALDQLLSRLMGIEREEIKVAKDALVKLEESIQTLIHDLTPKDFEILIDILFREAGLQRVSILGGKQAVLDLDLVSPITGKRFGIQIKAKANKRDYDKFLLDIKGMDHDLFYFAVHSPSKLKPEDENERVKILFPNQVSKLSLKYGLSDWIIKKAR